MTMETWSCEYVRMDLMTGLFASDICRKSNGISRCKVVPLTMGMNVYLGRIIYQNIRL